MSRFDRVRTSRTAAFGLFDLALVAALSTPAVYAQSNEETGAPVMQGLEEIIVTATKRAVSLQDVPVAVSAITSDDMVARGFTQYADYLNSMAGVYFGDGGPAQSVVRIRGMSVVEGGLPTTVATYVGEVPTSVHGSFPNLRLVDIERVEVLRGPQGTLFGANALSGAVRVLPAQADPEGYEVNLGARGAVTAHSDDASYHVEGTFNLPLVKDVFALRFTGYKDDIAGYIDNIVPAQAPIDWTATGEALLSLLTGQPVDLPDGALIVPGSGAIARKDVNREDTVGGRVSATWQASDQLRVELSYSMQEVTLDSEQYATAGAGEYVQVRRLDAFREGELKEELEIGSLTVRYDWDTVSLISASGWTTVDLTQSLDATPTVERLFFASVPAAQVQTRNGDAFTQELRLQSRGDSALQWLFGAYYLDRETHLQQVFLDYSCPTCLPNVVFGEDFLFSGESFVNEKQKAVFGEVSYALSPRWTVGVGGRWLDEELRYRVPRAGGIAANGAIPPTDITDSVTEVNPSAFLRFQPSDDMTLYLQAARGFRAGSPNQTLPSVCDADVAARRIKPITEPDTAWNYEFGLKSALADNRVNVNLAVYHADWKDIQIPGNLPCGFASVSNAGDATARGVEVELLAQPWDAWKFNLSASYNDNEFDRVRPETGYINGERLPLSPKKNVSAGVEYGFPIGSTEWSGYARADYQYVGDLRLIFFRAPNPATPLVPGRDVVTQDAYGTGNVKLGFTRDDLAVELYGRNVTDKRAVVSTGDPTFGGYETLLRPREFGVELRYSFR